MQRQKNNNHTLINFVLMKKLYALCAASMMMCASVQAETIELTASLSPSTLKYQPAMGGWSFEFNDDTESYTICTLIEGETFTGESIDELIGTYTIDNLSPYLSFITDPSFMLWVTFVDANITVAANDNNGVDVNMEITGDDANVYKITATYATQSVVEEKDVDFGNNVSIKYYESDGDWYIQAENDEYKMNLDILSTELDGIYKVSDFNPLYTFVDDLVKPEKYIYIIDAEVTIATADGISTLGGWITLETGVKLNIHGEYVDTATAIENISESPASQTKCWSNGRLLIRHHGVTYGLNGVHIK